MLGNYEVAKQECHVIAYVYNWGRNEIFNLTTKERKEFVEMIHKQKALENGEKDF